MNWNALVETAENAMNALDPDPDHARQVCRLALEIFDQLAPLHGLNPAAVNVLTPRQILELAAMLHDIGWTATGKGGHHKKSYSRIMDMDLPGVSDTDRSKIALTARYHRKRHPDPARHYAFAEMLPDDQLEIRWLAGILRIADGLDRAHASDVDRIICHTDPGTITFEIRCGSDFATAVYGANRKKQLLEEISGCTVVITP